MRQQLLRYRPGPAPALASNTNPVLASSTIMPYDNSGKNSYGNDFHSSYAKSNSRSSTSPRPKNTNRSIPAYSSTSLPTPMSSTSEISNNDITRQLGSAIARFHPNNASEPAEIAGLQPVVSYSWVSAATPTIIVPGLPPIWSSQPVSRVPADSGSTCVSQNGARMGDRSPLIPLFAAVVDQGKEDILRHMDIVCNRNNLCKLLRWANGTADEDFRIDVELAGDTCLFTKVEERAFQGFRGYGREYEKAATRKAPGQESTAGHHRIVSYAFGGLNILLRFEVDACTNADDAAEDESLDELVSTSSARLDANSQRLDEPINPFSGLTILHRGSRRLVPQANMIELKTRAVSNALDWTEVYPQLYFSQTTHLYLAKHNRGTFRPVEKFQLGSSQMAPHASAAEAGIGRLADGLKQILEAVRKEGDGVGLGLVCQRGQLTLHRRQEGTGRSVGREIRDLFRPTIG